MKKKIIYQLILLSTLSISIHSCRTDEMMATTEQTQKEKIALFERFERERNLAKSSVSNYAIPFGYSMLAYFNNYPEKKIELEGKYGIIDLSVSSQDIDLDNGRKLLIFPMLTNGKVTAVIGGVINAERDYLYFDVYKERHPDCEYLIKKFQNYYNTRSVSKGSSNNPTNVGEVIITIKKPELTYPDPTFDPGGSGGHDMDGGNGEYTNGGGGSNGTPNPPATNNPCEKMKEEKNKPKFQEKVSSLDKPDIFKAKKESGFSAAYGQPTSNYDPLVNNSQGNMIMPEGNKYYGFMHTHQDRAGVIKIFSPADIFTFLSTCVRNSQDKGSIADAYGMVITSQGNYILKYSGDGSYGLGPNQLNNWNDWYKTEYDKIKNDDGTFSQEKVEKLFLQFMDEKVKISGLEIYKSDKTTGNTSKLKLDTATGTIVPTPC